MGTGKVIAVTIVTAAITSAATFMLLRALDRSALLAPEKVEVPGLSGLSQDQARILLEPRGLALVVSGHREDQKNPAGSVVEQMPFEGARVERGSEVRVVVSRAEQQVAVPGLAGLNVTAAKQLLAQSGLTAGTVSRQPSSEVGVDLLLRSSPSAGHTVGRGASVDLVVSSGPPEVTVPSLVNKPASRARQEIERAGLTVGRVTYGYDEDRRGGLVIRQSPAAQTQAPAGSAVDIVVNESD